MRNKAESFESVLARAEKAFGRGNYVPARTDFEKALKMTDSEGMIAAISEKIEICKRELDALRAKELLKKARKLLQKNNVRDAIRGFEEAYAITGESWIRDKLKELRVEQGSRDDAKAAREAENAGRWREAAQRYGQAFLAGEDEGLLAAKVRCLVKGSQYQEALETCRSAFGPSGFGRAAVLYDYGLALVKTGRYLEGLKAWEGIDSRDNRLAEQREKVRALLAEDLIVRFQRGDDASAIYREGAYLLDSMGDREPCGRELASVIEYCRFAAVESLWDSGQYEAAAALLLPFPSRMTSPLLALYAKIYYKLAESSGAHASELALFWLTAVYDRDLSESFGGEEEERGKVRRDLLRRAEELIRKAPGNADELAPREEAYWVLENRLMEELHRLAMDLPSSAAPICTPRFAERFGRSAEVLDFLRSREDRFASRESYLTIGGYYGRVRESLYQLEIGDFEGAVTHLPGPGIEDDFERFAGLLVNFRCGLHYLEVEGSKPGRFFAASAALFDIAPHYEDVLVQKAMEAYELKLLDGYEDSLTRIHRLRSSQPIRRALSAVMTERAMQLYDDSKINSKGLETILKEALKLYPENDHARLGLGDARSELEISEMQKALHRHRMSKAFKIAHESEFDTVREQYFVFLEDMVDGLEKADFSREEKVFIYKELRGWCAKMDSSHRLLERIDESLKMLR